MLTRRATKDAAETARFEAGTQIWRPLDAALNLECRNQDC